MKRNIAEELPARQHPPASAEKKDSGVEKEKERGKTPDDRVKKALDDIRYRARREDISLLQAYSQYMQSSTMPQNEKMEVKQKLFGKEQSVMKAEDFNIQDFASSSVANALYKVFVENYKKEDPIVLPYIQEMENAKSRKYSVEVINKDGTSYDRWATREKISKLRANPNIKDIVMKDERTSEPYEGKKKDKPKRWWDDDGDGIGYEKGEVSGKFKKKKDVKEQFIGELAAPKNEVADKKTKKIDVMSGTNNITMSPNLPGTGNSRGNSLSLQVSHYDNQRPFITETPTSRAEQIFFNILQEKSESVDQQKLFGLALSVKRGETPRSEVSAQVLKIVDTMSEKKIRDFAKTTHEGLPKKVHKEEAECECDETPKNDSGSPCEDDVRSIPTTMNLAKNKLRSMGLKCSYEPEGELVDEGTGLSVGAAKLLGKVFSNPRTPEAQAARDAQRLVTDPISRAVKSIVRPPGGEARQQELLNRRRPQTSQQRQVAARTQQVVNQSYEPEGEVIDESKLGDAAREIERREAKKGGLKRKRTKKEVLAHNLAQSQRSDSANLETQKRSGDTGLHRGATRPEPEDDENTSRRRRRYSDHGSLSARERNPGLR